MPSTASAPVRCAVALYLSFTRRVPARPAIRRVGEQHVRRPATLVFGFHPEPVPATTQFTVARPCPALRPEFRSYLNNFQPGSRPR